MLIQVRNLILGAPAVKSEFVALLFHAPTSTKYCPRCEAQLPLSEFYKAGKGGRWYSTFCKKHTIEANSKRKKK